MENWKIEETENEMIIKIPKEKDYTLDDLRQKLINKFYNQNSYEECEVEILRILFDLENKHLISEELKKFNNEKATNYIYN